MATALERFWANVVEEDTPRIEGISVCWLWLGSDRGQYGVYRTVLAHRAAAAIYTCQMPSKVTMRCGNPRCVRKEHLLIRTLLERKAKISRLTNRPLPLPTYRDPNIVKQVLHDRKTMRKGNIVESVARANGLTNITVKKIFAEAPIYELMYEVVACIAEKRKYQSTPHKKVSDLTSGELARYKYLIQSKTGVTNAKAI